ncbi:MAG: YqiA/YcfP family alpha/beta fold hydrolase [Polynucleobacter victoriensis]
MAAKGDEVLDWQEMVAKYNHAKQLVLEGGDHALSNYLELLPTVLAFHDLKAI